MVLDIQGSTGWLNSHSLSSTGCPGEGNSVISSHIPNVAMKICPHPLCGSSHHGEVEEVGLCHLSSLQPWGGDHQPYTLLPTLLLSINLDWATATPTIVADPFWYMIPSYPTVFTQQPLILPVIDSLLSSSTELKLHWIIWIFGRTGGVSLARRQGIILCLNTQPIFYLPITVQ